MLEEAFKNVYEKFKMNFYRNIFHGFSTRESSLTASETFCTEVIYVLKKPTIKEVGEFLNVSQPNITYKINNLVKKGYVRKIPSESDKREVYVEVTERFHTYYNIKNRYMELVLQRARERFSEEELKNFEHILTVISEELMPEAELPLTAGDL